jgi:type II secretory pathway component GspD/PulD (secretin)
MRRLPLLALLPALLALPPLTAADTPKAAPERGAAEAKRGAYVVKFGSAKDLAAVLAKHFKGAAEIQAGPDGSGNVLLVSAPPPVFDEAMKTVELLDTKPQTIVVEVWLVEVPAGKADDKGAAALDEKALAGPIEDVAKAVEAMQKKGQAAGVKHFRLSTLEWQTGSMALDAIKPYATGSRTFAYRSTGTYVYVKPLAAANKTVTLHLSVHDGRLVIPKDGAQAGTDEKGNPILAPEFPLAELSSKVAVASGKVVVAGDANVTPKAGESRVLILVGARVVEPSK